MLTNSLKPKWQPELVGAALQTLGISDLVRLCFVALLMPFLPISWICCCLLSATSHWATAG
jgi:hypothetical protein